MSVTDVGRYRTIDASAKVTNVVQIRQRVYRPVLAGRKSEYAKHHRLSQNSDLSLEEKEFAMLREEHAATAMKSVKASGSSAYVRRAMPPRLSAKPNQMPPK